jgi:hypothetical protein
MGESSVASKARENACVSAAGGRCRRAGAPLASASTRQAHSTCSVYFAPASTSSASRGLERTYAVRKSSSDGLCGATMVACPCRRVETNESSRTFNDALNRRPCVGTPRASQAVRNAASSAASVTLSGSDARQRRSTRSASSKPASNARSHSRSGLLSTPSSNRNSSAAPAHRVLRLPARSSTR